MATDGSGPVEQDQAILSGVLKPKESLWKKLIKKNPPPAEKQAPPPPKEEPLPGEMGAVMAELKRKNQELDGNLISEFGEGESKFVALIRPLVVDESKGLSEGQREGKKGFEDYLIVTSDGFKILRITKGKWDVKDQFHRRDEDNMFTDITRRLVLRGNPSFQSGLSLSDAGRDEMPTESSGYTFGNGVHKLNFGKGPALEFNQYGPDVASFNDPSAELRNYLKRNRSYGGESADRGLDRIRRDAAKLISDPDQAEVAEIMQTNIEEAKNAKDSRKAAKLADEAKKMAEAEAAKKPEKDKMAAEDAKRQEAERQKATQSQTADSVLDILGKP